MPTLALADVELYYEVRGEGAPLLLIGGLAADSQSWLPIVPLLAKRCRVITCDNRGVGRTVPQEAPNSIRRMTDDCVALVRHLGLNSLSVLGYSMGGFIAQDLATRYPELVERLLLASTAARNSRRNNDLFMDLAAALDQGADPKAWFRNFFYWIFSAGFFDDRKMVEVALRLAVTYPYPQSAEAFRRQVGAIAEFGGVPLAQLCARTLVLGGTEDLLFPARLCADFAKALPDAAWIPIEGTAHCAYIEQPQQFVQHVLDFVLPAISRSA
ncbi:MAG: alpha/beta hydrolase [Casimicrobiaceae bacterium]